MVVGNVGVLDEVQKSGLAVPYFRAWGSGRYRGHSEAVDVLELVELSGGSQVVAPQNKVCAVLPADEFVIHC